MAPTAVRDGEFRLFFFSREESRIHMYGSAKRRPLSKFTFRKSKMPGTVTSKPEVTHVSVHGLWLLLGQEELHLPFEKFPWFKQATIEQLSEVEWPSPNHLYWPRLDVDLSVESVRKPEAFPLVSAPAAI